MHILLLNDDILPEAKGGSAVIADLQRKEYTRLGHKVTVITSHQDASRDTLLRWKDDGGDVISIHVNYRLSERHRRCIRIPKISIRLEQLIQELRPDVVHAHVIHTYLTYDALRIARTVTDKVFLTAHDTFLVSFDRVKGNRLCRSALENKPYVMRWWEHVAAVGRKYSPSRNSKIKRILSETGTTVIAVSHAIEDFLKANGIANTVTVHNAIPDRKIPSDEDAKTYRSSLGLTGPTILYGGRINADKGIGVLLQAMQTVWESLPDAQLLVTGEMNRLTPHLAPIPKEMRSKIICTGWIDQEQMPLAYASADVITTPSIYLDAFNLMNIEAMQMGKPVVGTCFGGTAEIVENEVTGIIVDPRDTEAYATALVGVLTDPVAAKRMGAEGKKRVRSAFSLKVHIEEHLAWYEAESPSSL